MKRSKSQTTAVSQSVLTVAIPALGCALGLQLTFGSFITQRPKLPTEPLAARRETSSYSNKRVSPGAKAEITRLPVAQVQPQESNQYEAAYTALISGEPALHSNDRA